MNPDGTMTEDDLLAELADGLGITLDEARRLYGGEVFAGRDGSVSIRDRGTLSNGDPFAVVDVDLRPNPVRARRP